LAIALRTIEDVAVDTAASAEEAIRAMKVSPADVLITDVGMGGMSGLELLVRLRESGCWPSCGAVVISGETDSELPRRALECGAALFFRKPFSAGEVRRSVISLLEDCHGVE
jgi:DNA-binding response OmpR family regulator